MTKLSLLFLFAFLLGSAIRVPARQDQTGNTVIHKVVSLVQLNIAVIDSKGRYVAGLRPSDFVVTEDGIHQRIATFLEGNEAPTTLESGVPPAASSGSTMPGAGAALLPPPAPDGTPSASAGNASSGSLLTGSDVFILFDSSNYMYRGRGFVYAQDAIADFVRSLDPLDRVAFYSYSRDLSRAAILTPDRQTVIRGVRATVDGDDAALYNALLLTLKDAGQYRGRKVVVVFSNGPDNASMVAPEDVDEFAQSEGIPVYIVSTQDARLDPASTAVFSRISSRTGGEAFFAKNWTDERQAFNLIREDLAHLYFLSYYPQPNPNPGWRKIAVKVVSQNAGKYRIRTRSGYRPVLAYASVPE